MPVAEGVAAVKVPLRSFHAEAHEMLHGGGWIVRLPAPEGAALLAPSAFEARRLLRALVAGLADAEGRRLKARLKWRCETPRGQAEVDALRADLAAKYG